MPQVSTEKMTKKRLRLWRFIGRFFVYGPYLVCVCFFEVFPWDICCLGTAVMVVGFGADYYYISITLLYLRYSLLGAVVARGFASGLLYVLHPLRQVMAHALGMVLALSRGVRYVSTPACCIFHSLLLHLFLHRTEREYQSGLPTICRLVLIIV